METPSGDLSVPAEERLTPLVLLLTVASIVMGLRAVPGAIDRDPDRHNSPSGMSRYNSSRFPLPKIV